MNRCGRRPNGADASRPKGGVHHVPRREIRLLPARRSRRPHGGGHIGGAGGAGRRHPRPGRLRGPTDAGYRRRNGLAHAHPPQRQRPPKGIDFKKKN